MVDGVTILRTWLYTKPAVNFIGRLANYLLFSALALVTAISKLGAQDFVITECPSLCAGIAGFIISKCKRAKFALNISDLWTDSAIALGMLKNSTLIAMTHRMEHFLYRKAHLITCQTQGIVNGVRSSVPRAPIALITNGIDQDFFTKASESRANKRHKTQVPPEKFVVGYAGLHGLVQDLKTVIEAARLLRENQNITFAFYGDGPQEAILMRQAQEAQLKNVTFFPPQPLDRMPEIFSRFDVMVVPLKDLPILRGAIPCKLLETMSDGLPVLLAGLVEARTVLDQAQCGTVRLLRIRDCWRMPCKSFTAMSRAPVSVITTGSMPLKTIVVNG